MPFIVAELGQLPPPLGGFENVFFSGRKFLSHQQNQFAIPDKERHVVAVFLCKQNS